MNISSIIHSVDCRRNPKAAEKYVSVVQDMSRESETAVRSAAGMTKGFTAKVGLHQRSALNPFLFAVLMDRLDEVRQEAPRAVLVALHCIDLSYC